MGDSPATSALGTTASTKATDSTKDTESSLPYWQVNVAPSLRSPTCPPFLSNLSPKDLSIISTPDSSYHTLTWPEVLTIITLNRLDLFQRRPSSLRAYLAHNHALGRQYGSVTSYFLTHRLGWSLPVVPAGRPFQCQEDVKVLWNDWPYGIDERIVHLVVWTKFELEEGVHGGLSEEMREMVEGWVRRTFCTGEGGVERDEVEWFKNWASLKSIRQLEHFHVMLFDPPGGLVERIAGGDVPGFKKVREGDGVV